MGSGGGGGFGGWVRDKVEKVKDFFGISSGGTGRAVSKEESYDPEKAKMEETLRINNILVSFRTTIETKSDKLEKDALEISRKSIDGLIDYLKSINNKKYSGKALNINIERLIRENRKTEDSIHGYIKKHVQKRVSLDDSECLAILKMESGSEKENKMTAFSNKVLGEAIKELSNKIRKSIQEQADNIADQIKDRIDLVESTSANTIEKYKEIEKLKENNEEGLESEITNMGYFISLCDNALNQLQN